MASRGVSVYSRHMHLDGNDVIRFTPAEEAGFGVDIERAALLGPYDRLAESLSEMSRLCHDAAGFLDKFCD